MKWLIVFLGLFFSLSLSAQVYYTNSLTLFKRYGGKGEWLNLGFKMSRNTFEFTEDTLYWHYEKELTTFPIEGHNTLKSGVLAVEIKNPDNTYDAVFIGKHEISVTHVESETGTVYLMVFYITDEY
jgi:hypothetical protein